MCYSPRPLAPRSMYMAERDSIAPAASEHEAVDTAQSGELKRAESYVREVLAHEGALRGSTPPESTHIVRAKSAIAASGKSRSMRVPLPSELGSAPIRRTAARSSGEVPSARAEMIAVLRASVEEATGGTGRSLVPSASASVTSTLVGVGAPGQAPLAVEEELVELDVDVELAPPGALAPPELLEDQTETVPLAVEQRPIRAASSEGNVWSSVATVPSRRLPSPVPEASIVIDGQVPNLETEQTRPTSPALIGVGPLRLPTSPGFEPAPFQARSRKGRVVVAVLALFVGGVVAFSLRGHIRFAPAADSTAALPIAAVASSEPVVKPVLTAAEHPREPTVRVVNETQDQLAQAQQPSAMNFEDLPAAGPVKRAQSSDDSSSGSASASNSGAATMARLSINSIPVSDVFINGKSVGHTPLRNLAVPPGTSAIIFVHPKLGKRRTDVSLEPGQKRVVTKKF